MLDNTGELERCPGLRHDGLVQIDAVRDIDADGDLDLILTDYSGKSVYTCGDPTALVGTLAFGAISADLYETSFRRKTFSLINQTPRIASPFNNMFSIRAKRLWLQKRNAK